MNYNEFLDIINDNNFNKNEYDKLVKEYGYTLIQKYFSKFIDSNLSEEDYEKCKFYLDDELSRETYDLSYTSISSEAQYLQEIGRIPLLSPNEERELLVKSVNVRKKLKLLEEKYNVKTFIKKYGKNLDDLDVKNKNVKLLKQYLTLNKEYNILVNKLTESNLRLVASVARRYKGNNVDFLDLIQEGNLGIKEAIDKFDIEKGNRFSTYAMWWIRRRIVREIHLNSRLIKLPVNKHELYYKIKKASDLFEKETGRVASSKELLYYIQKKVSDGSLNNSKYFENLTTEKIEGIKKIFQGVTSLNIKVGKDNDNEDSYLEEFIVDDKQDSVEDIVLKSSISDEINEFLNVLTPRFKLIIILRFGFSLRKYMSYSEFLNCFNEKKHNESFYEKLYNFICVSKRTYTLEEIGQMYNISRERIRQMEAKALRLIKIRNKIINDKIKEKVLYKDLFTLYK